MSVRSYIVDDREKKTFLLDREVLVSEEILRREMAQIFGRCWIYVGHSSELKAPVIAVGPAVIDALEAAPVALALGADYRAAVAAGVEQAMERAALVAAEDDRPARHLAGAEIAGLLELGGMADIDPAAGEDLRHLLAQDVFRHQDLAVEQE